MLGVVEAITKAAQKAMSNVWYIAPTYDMVRDLGWEPMLQALPPELIAGKPNETRLELRLVNGSLITCKSADRPDRLRGRGLDLAVLDEARWMEKRIWGEVIRPALADRQGRALFLSTPSGFDWFYDLWLRAQQEVKDWASWAFTTLDGGWVPHDEVVAARADMDPRTFRQEFEASFEALAGRVYYTFDRNAHVSNEVVDRGAEILVGQDFNVNPMASVIAQRAGDVCEVLDALEIPSSNTEEVAAEIKRRYPERRVVFYPDPSGTARKTSAPVGQTDFTILRRAGFQVYAPSRAPAVVDRINNTNTLLQAADGTRRVVVSPKAQKLIRAWDGLTYKEGTNIADKNLKGADGGALDHICDAFDYMAWSAFNVLRAEPAMERMRMA